MLAIFLSYAVGLLSIFNAGQTHNLALVIINWIVGVAFIASGSISGWQYARNYKN